MESKGYVDPNSDAEREAEKTKTEADRIMKEKQDNINNRFNAVLGEKKFSHDAIREAYLKKFGDALENTDYQGKSDTEIFHDLTKDDATAFTGVTAVKLQGGRPQGVGGQNIDEARARAVMGLPVQN